MKIKYFIIYAFVGIAFLAVSAWVFFSHGKDAKAIRAKYRLGGIMLMCMTMLSTASCGEVSGPGEVMCYDPAPEYSISVSTGQHGADRQDILTPGSALTVGIDCPYYGKYGIVIRKYEDGKEGEILQTASVDAGGKDRFEYELLYDPADKTYAGAAKVDVYGYPEGEEEGGLLSTHFLLISSRAD